MDCVLAVVAGGLTLADLGYGVAKGPSTIILTNHTGDRARATPRMGKEKNPSGLEISVFVKTLQAADARSS